MRRGSLVGVLSLVVALLLGVCPAAAEGSKKRPAHRQSARPGGPTLTIDFVNADLVYAIKVLAKAMKRNVYIGPGVEGSVTLSIRKAPPEATLALVLGMQESSYDYRVVSNGAGGQTIIVAPPEKLATIPYDTY